MVDIQVVAAPATGGNPVAAGTLVTLPNPSSTPSASGALVAMGSSRLGMRAGFAWTVPGQPQINVQSLGADGRAQGAPLVQASSTTAPQVPCLSFINGKDDLAVGFLTQVSTADPNPSWTLVEVRDDGALDDYVTFRLGTVNPSCPLSAATTGGYVTTWQNQLGSWIGVYDAASNLLTSHLFAGAVTFGGRRRLRGRAGRARRRRGLAGRPDGPGRDRPGRLPVGGRSDGPDLNGFLVGRCVCHLRRLHVELDRGDRRTAHLRQGDLLLMHRGGPRARFVE
jgi:hypothetical protein